MTRKELEELIGEDMEDMGLAERVDDIECADCGGLIAEDDHMRGKTDTCRKCRKAYGG